jgi:multimeric flavodoxin WrbA
MKNTFTKKLATAALVGLLATGAVTACEHSHDAAGNSCKGQNSCKGNNSCKNN